MKSVLVLSDCHVGSRLAVAPLSYEMKDGSSYKSNKVQRALFAAWSEVSHQWAKPDILVLNGEPVDGQGVKSRGVEQWTTNWDDQIDAAVELVKMFKAKRIYVTMGSGYHIEQGGVSIEEIFGERVGAEKVDGHFVTPELFLTVEGVTLNLAHHLSSSSSGWNYRSTAIAKEMMLGQLSKAHKYDFDILVRSHIHYFWAVESAGKLGVITPVWQLQTPFMQKKGTMGTIPDIGAVRFIIDGTSYHLEKKLFRLAEGKPAKVTVA